MIDSFACKETEKIWNCKHSKKLLPKFSVDIQNRALRKLRQLEVAKTMDDLRNPPSNHLEALKGDRAGQYSIRITKKLNYQWRICFDWLDNNACHVEIVDYHQYWHGLKL